MPEFEVHWCTSGMTRVEADSEADARAVLTEYPFSDDANRTEVVGVVALDDSYVG